MAKGVEEGWVEGDVACERVIGSTVVKVHQHSRHVWVEAFERVQFYEQAEALRGRWPFVVVRKDDPAGRKAATLPDEEYPERWKRVD
jgi:hypothetical protein